MQRSDQFDVEAAKTTARKPAAMVRGVCLLANLPSKNTLTTTQQHLLTHHDLNGQQRLPWCPTPSAATYNADCGMRQHRKWGTMAAVGWWWPPWSMGHGLDSFS
jgi:hypothetical protein